MKNTPTISAIGTATIIVGESLGRCAFCGGNIAVSTDDEPGLLHSLPTCAAFDDMEPNDFLEATRRKLEAKGQA